MLKKQAGFTLVETMLALAITGLMLTMVLNGRASLKGNGEALDAGERLRNQLVDLQNQALTGESKGSGNHPDQIYFGTRAFFGDYDPFGMIAPGTYYTDEIVRLAPPAGVEPYDIRGERDHQNIQLTHGFKFDSAASTADEVVFVRNQASGQLETYTMKGRFHGSDGDRRLYNPSATPNTDIILRFRNSETGKSFDIIINPKTNGIRRGPTS